MKDRAEEFLQFMKDRELIRLRREAGLPREEWTDDEVFKTYSFTNVQRFYDRTTQVFYNEFYKKQRGATWESQLYNAALFRWFGSVDFVRILGWQNEFKLKPLFKAVRECREQNLNVFTGAYIVPACGRSEEKHIVAIEVMGGVWEKCEEMAKEAEKTNSWEKVYDIMTQIHGYGGSGFMAKEALQDALLLPVLEKADDRHTWTPVGPGGRRGLNRVNRRKTKEKLREDDAIEEVLALHKAVQKPWGRWRDDINSSKLGCRKKPTMELSAHDVQFQLCEYDKYCRVKEGSGRPRQRFHPRSDS